MFDNENLRGQYLCNCGGSISLLNNYWQCDKCSFAHQDGCDPAINLDKIPTLDDCMADSSIIPSWEILAENIYQYEKALFLLKQIASSYHYNKYKFETPDPRNRMKEEGVKLYQQICLGFELPEKDFIEPELEKKFG